MRSSAASASASGAERDPGARQASRDAVARPLVDQRAGERGGGVARSWEDASMRIVLVPRVHADGRVVGPVRAPCATGRSTACAVEVPDGLDFVATAHALGDEGGVGDYVGYSMGGRLCLQLALDRPELVERLVLVERVARASPIPPSARRGATPTSAGAARSSATASTRSSSGGWRSRCSRRCHATRRASRIASPATPSARLAHQLRSLGQGAQPSNWDRLGELAMPVLLVAGSRDTKYVDIAERMAATRSRERARRGHRGAGPRLPPRADRTRSLTCSPPG